MNQNITSKVENGVGWLTLNRADKLNALSVPMINELHEIFRDWKVNDEVKLVVLQGSGEKAFCAGGDVRHLYDRKGIDVHDVAQEFFDTEYRMNMLMHTFGKPILVYMNGIVMGGGVGVAVAGTHRIVTETTKWAMPEMNIGLYPDVGGSYFLNKMPHHIGRYLALTSFMVKAADVLYSGAADYYMSSSKWPELSEAIGKRDWMDVDVVSALEAEVGRFVEPCPDPAPLEDLSHEIEFHFGQSTLEAIVQTLEEASAQGHSWAEKTVETILTKSPTSLKVTLEQLIRGENLSIKDCFVMELEMSMNFMDSHDFFEGVRSVLVDKDRNPTWQPNTLEAISKDDVNAFFTYNWDSENPLTGFKL
jgi:enoyl-CoA hydratase/carnithine racemase